MNSATPTLDHQIQHVRNDIALASPQYADLPVLKAILVSLESLRPAAREGGLLGPVGWGVFLYNGHLREVVHTDGDKAYAESCGGQYVVPLYIQPTECASLNEAHPVAALSSPAQAPSAPSFTEAECEALEAGALALDCEGMRIRYGTGSPPESIPKSDKAQNARWVEIKSEKIHGQAATLRKLVKP